MSAGAGVRMGTRNGRWVLFATVLGSGMAAIDATAVGVALPTIGRDLHAPFSALQWVVTAYTLTLAALLLLGGSLGDVLGRRRVFTIGIAWFFAASLACSLTTTTTELIVMRALQGVGAALLTPGSLAIIQASFAPDDRGRAIGAWSGLGGVATAIGPVLGGVLVAVASWRWIFVINVPIGVVLLVVARRHVPESSDPDAHGQLDLGGAGLAVLALAGVTFGLIEGPTLGWISIQVVVMLSVGVLSGCALVLVERRASTPMLPGWIFAVRQFSVTNGVTFVVYAGLGGALFLLPVQLQVVDHYSALAAGASLLPVTALMLVLSSRSGALAARIGPRLQMTAGPAIVALGLVLLARTTDDPSYLTGVLPGVTVLGIGLATTVAPLTITALGALPSSHAGLASAVNNDVARLGSLLAVAVLPALAGITGESYLQPDQLADGFRTAVLVAGVACLAGAALAGVGIRNPQRSGSTDAVAAAVEPTYHCALEATPLAGVPSRGAAA